MKRFIASIALTSSMLLGCAGGQVFLDPPKQANKVDKTPTESFAYEVEPHHRKWGTIIWICFILVILFWAWQEFKSPASEERDEDTNK